MMLDEIINFQASMLNVVLLILFLVSLTHGSVLWICCFAVRASLMYWLD